MILKPLTGTFRSIILAGLILPCLAVSAWGLTLSFSSRPDIDTLNLDFTQKPEKPEIIRSGSKEITLKFPAGTLSQEKISQSGNLGQSHLVQGLNVSGDSIILTLSTDAIGFLPSPSGPRDVRLQIFRDPQGSNWRPPKPQAPEPQAAAKPEQASQAAAPEQAKQPFYAAPSTLRGEIKREAPAEAKTVQAEPQPQVQAQPQAPAQAVAQPPAQTAQAPVQAVAPGQTQAPVQAAAPEQAALSQFVGAISRPGVPQAQAPLQTQAQPAQAQPAQAQAVQQAEPQAQPTQAQAAQQTRTQPQIQGQIQPQTQAPLQTQAQPTQAQPTPAQPQTQAQVTGQIARPAGPQAAPAQTPAPQVQPAQTPAGQNSATQGATPPSQPNQVVGQIAAPPKPQAAPAQTTPAPASPEKPQAASPQAPPAPQGQASPANQVSAQIGPRPAAEAPAKPAVPPPAPEAKGEAKPAEKPAAKAEAKSEDKHAAKPEAKTGPQAPSEAELKAEQDKQDGENQEMLLSAQASQAMGEPQAAKEALDALLARPSLKKDVREEALYSLADIYYDLYKASLRQNIDIVQGAYQAAMNSDPKSKRVPQALLQLGNVNLRVGNYPEAKGYFNVLKQRYPNDENIPLIGYDWAEHYYSLGQYAKAAEEFQNLVQKYPDSRFVHEASLGLAKSLVKIGNYKQAAQIVDYVDKRWPRFYIDDPSFLRLMGDLNYRLENYAKAKDNYLTFYNLQPKAENMDMLLLRLGESYSRVGKNNIAADFYKKAIQDYPDLEGGIISRMRLAEEGIHDSPSIEEMFAAFDQPGKESPENTYAEIAKKYPESPLAPLAQLKLAMWKLYKGQYQQCLDEVAKFLKQFPNSELAERAREVAYKAFLGLVPQLAKEDKYPRILDVYKSLPYIAAKQESFPDEVQIAMAKAYLATNQEQAGLKILERYLPPQQPPLGETALNLALDVYLPKQDWRNVVALAERSKTWNLQPSTRRRLDFALALALETLGETVKSRPLWVKIGLDAGLPNSVRAVAAYNLAKGAFAAKEVDKALVLAQDTLALLGPDGDPDVKRGAINLAIEVNKLNKRPAEAIKWCEEYAKLTKPGEAAWAANQYRWAGFLRYTGNIASWRSMLSEIKDKAPDTLYGKTASAELESYKIENAAEKAMSSW